jgi:hypothetical protein
MILQQAARRRWLARARTTSSSASRTARPRGPTSANGRSLS